MKATDGVTLPGADRGRLLAIERKVAASETLSRWALAVGGPWETRLRARCAALLAEGADAGELYRESFSQLGQCRVAVDLTLTCSTALLYGQGLHQAKRLAKRGWAGTVGGKEPPIGLAADWASHWNAPR